MKTGEGKTQAATAAVLSERDHGRGVHVVTVNDYLAKRDSEGTGRAHHFLGLYVGATCQMTPAERRKAYNCRHHLRHQQ